MRNATHYRNLITQNPGAGIGFTLAASAIYAAQHGMCEAEQSSTDEWRVIARDLKSRYGETLSGADVLEEMDKAAAEDQGGDA